METLGLFEQAITYSPILVVAVAISAITHVLKLGLKAAWPGLSTAWTKFILQAAPVGLGILICSLAPLIPGDTWLAKACIGAGVGAFSEYGYRIVKHRLGGLVGKT